MSCPSSSRRTRARSGRRCVHFAIGNRDPFSGANVLARGLVGDRGGQPVVFSPMYKQAFELTSGRCLDDPAMTVPTFPVRVHGGTVEIATGLLSAGTGG